MEHSLPFSRHPDHARKTSVQKLALSVVGLMLAAGLVACKPKAPNTSETATNQPAATNVSAPCPDDGPRLPGTGICKGRSLAYLEPGGDTPPAPDGCTWDVNEAMIGTDQAILYQALQCKGVTTKLAASLGAHSATLTRERSGLYTIAGEPETVVELFNLPEGDPKLGLLELVAGNVSEKEAKDCALVPANLEGWPKDALVYTLKPEARAKLPANEPVSACGRFGRDEDESLFWRISQNRAWFFSLGQDGVDFDPGSITLIEKTAEGGWGAVS